MAAMRADLIARGCTPPATRTSRCGPCSTRLDHRLDHPGRAAASSPSTASPRPAPAPRRAPGPVPLSWAVHPADGRLPALRLGGHRGDVRVRRHRVQGAAPLPVLPGAVRAREGDLTCLDHLRRRPTPTGGAPCGRPERRRRPGSPRCGVARGAAHRRRGRGHLRRAGRAGRGLRLPARPVAHPAPQRRPRRAPVVLDLRRRPGAPPRIGVREVPGGLFSSWLVHEVRPGDAIEVAAAGRRASPPPDRTGHHVLVAAGSGITPVLSIAAVRAGATRPAASPCSTATAARTR